MRLQVDLCPFSGLPSIPHLFFSFLSTCFKAGPWLGALAPRACKQGSSVAGPGSPWGAFICASRKAMGLGKGRGRQRAQHSTSAEMGEAQDWVDREF